MFSDDPDCPGLTYPTPIEWAPWMETIWLGNYYDNRSAYFHYVMYSNQKPGREGALLFRDPLSSLQLALLYQRYKKFDERSYGLSNGTFFNVFSAEPLRLGRYQLPQCDTVILCATDPLTYSELKRYLNSFNVLKWFKAKFLQQKRKRQYILQVLTVELLTVSSNALSSAAAHAFLASDTDSGQEGEQVMSVALVMKESK